MSDVRCQMRDVRSGMKGDRGNEGRMKSEVRCKMREVRCEGEERGETREERRVAGCGLRSPVQSPWSLVLGAESPVRNLRNPRNLWIVLSASAVLTSEGSETPPRRRGDTPCRLRHLWMPSSVRWRCRAEGGARGRGRIWLRTSGRCRRCPGCLSGLRRPLVRRSSVCRCRTSGTIQVW